MKIRKLFSEAWTWCLGHLLVFVPVILVIILIPIAIATFGKDEDEVSREFSTSSPADAEELVEVPPRTEEGYIVYDMSSGIVMKKGEKRTFNVPFGTKIRRYNTTGKVTRHSTKGKDYVLEALEDVTFDLVWVVEKGFEKKVKTN